MKKAEDVRRAAVLGSGTMGHGIAQVLAASGITTRMHDVAQDALDRATVKVRANLEQGVEKGKVTAEQRDGALERLTTSTDLDHVLEGAEVVIEAVPEKLELKRDVFARLGRLAPDVLLATNTSSLSISAIAAAAGHPERVVGMHFFNPVHKMKLLEIVRGATTSDETIARARAWGESLGKTSIVVNESPGLTTSRMSALMGNEAMYMLMEGVASAEDIDTALRLGFNHPMGPLELGDLTGWDTRLAVLRYLHSTLGERFNPCPLIAKLVEAGRTGRKTGKGVFDYVDGIRVPGSDPGIR
jgi:3-hydroxybutyryl-CoA dehydrogenase